MRNPLACMVISLAGLLSACSGSNFTRPADGEFVPGATAIGEILDRMGKTRFTDEATANGEPIAVLSYAYAQGPAVRAITFLLHDDLLVGMEFTSSFPADRSWFDPDKARSVRPGMSRLDVETLLGKAPGEYRYPLTSDRKSTAMVYKFAQMEAKFQRRMLVVEIDDQDAVHRVEFDDLLVPRWSLLPQLTWSD